MIQPLSSTSRLMMIGLSSEDRSLIDLGVLARWTIRPALMGIPGVANVSVWGQREQQLQVQVDPQELGEKGVSLDDVIRTTGNALWVSPLTFLEASTPGAGGFYDTNAQRIGVEHTQPIKTPEDLAGVTIERADDSAPPPADGAAAPQRLEDVATVVEDHQPLIGDAVFTDGPGLLIVVEKLPGANALEVTDKLDSAVDSLRPGLSDVEIDTSFFRPASYIDQSDDNLRFALIVGIALLVLVLGALLFDLRRMAVKLASILVSMSAAVLVLDLRGETINAMVLAGLVLALVIIIDDAVSSAQDADSERSTLASRSPAAARPLLRGRGDRLDAGRAHVHPCAGGTRPHGRRQSVPGHRATRSALPARPVTVRSFRAPRRHRGRRAPRAGARADAHARQGRISGPGLPGPEPPGAPGCRARHRAPRDAPHHGPRRRRAPLTARREQRRGPRRPGRPG
jgi:hypothetical protein